MQKELKNPKNAASPYRPKGSQGAITCVSIISGEINPPIVHIAIPNEMAFDLEKLFYGLLFSTPTHPYAWVTYLMGVGKSSAPIRNTVE